jgi:hypothetical protein
MTIGKKIGTLIACGALVAAIGAVSVSASSPFTTLRVKVEDGVKYYSADDGKTWSAEAPKRVIVTTDAHGKAVKTRGATPGNAAPGNEAPGNEAPGNRAPWKGEGGSFVKVKDGKVPDSAEYRKTRGIGKGEGVQEGGIGGPENLLGAKSLLVKVEDGVKRYSTDGGKTWSEDAPEGYSERDGIPTR